MLYLRPVSSKACCHCYTSRLTPNTTRPSPPACSYEALCGPGSVVPQCKSEGAIPELKGSEAWYMDALTMCKAMPEMEGCAACVPQLDDGMVSVQALQVQCPDPLGEGEWSAGEAPCLHTNAPMLWSLPPPP